MSQGEPGRVISSSTLLAVSYHKVVWLRFGASCVSILNGCIHHHHSTLYNDSIPVVTAIGRREGLTERYTSTSTASLEKGEVFNVLNSIIAVSKNQCIECSKGGVTMVRNSFLAATTDVPLLATIEDIPIIDSNDFKYSSDAYTSVSAVCSGYLWSNGVVYIDENTFNYMTIIKARATEEMFFNMRYMGKFEFEVEVSDGSKVFSKHKEAIYIWLKRLNVELHLADARPVELARLCADYDDEPPKKIFIYRLINALIKSQKEEGPSEEV